MNHIADPIAPPFQHFYFVIEALNKATALAPDKIITDLLQPLIQGLEKAVETLQAALSDFGL